MLAFLIWLSIAPVVWFLAARFLWPRDVVWGEAAAGTGICVLLASVVYGVVMFSSLRDTEILNGQVTGKERVLVSCSHSYSCRCYTSCNSKGSCTRHCSTCYEHSFDYDWRVYTSVGTKEIDRVNRQGTKEPPRWSMVRIGEPASTAHQYINYVKGAPHSLFNTKLAEIEAKQYAAILPERNGVYDYYRYNHVYNVGSTVNNVDAWNGYVSDHLRKLGPSKQVNINLVMTSNPDRRYKSVLERKWLGGRKNDVTLIISADKTGKILWADSFTYGNSVGNAMLNVVLRDNIERIGTVNDPALVVSTTAVAINKYFVRPEMANFEYLKADVRPGITTVVVAIILQFVAMIGLTFMWRANSIRSYHGSGTFDEWVETLRTSLNTLAYNVRRNIQRFISTLRKRK